MKPVFDYLQALGLSPIEAKLYIYLLQAGPLTVKELAKKAKINRTATYTHINPLLEKGIIAQTKGVHKQLIAIEPERLYYLVENQLDSVHALQNKFPSILNQIHATLKFDKTQEKLDVRYYKGEVGLETIYIEAFKANELRCYANLNELDKMKWTTKFMNDEIFERALAQNKKLKIYEIVADAPNSVAHFELDRTTKTGRYQYKFAPSNIGLSSGTLIYDNAVAIFNIKQEISGIVLNNPEYYHNSKKLFDFIWQMLPEIKA